MANSKRRCTYCKDYRPVLSMVIVPIGAFCCDNHRYLYGIEKTEQLLKKSRRIEKEKHAVQKRKDKAKKKELMTRSQWYNKLQTLVNQYITKVRDKNEGCFTCGTAKPTIKYDAGHCFTRASRPDIRFDLSNIHKQCSVKCNQHGSGMRAEYFVAITKKYGEPELDRLKLKGEPLKEQFPTWQDIENEIIRYRKILRCNDVTPNA